MYYLWSLFYYFSSDFLRISTLYKYSKNYNTTNKKYEAKFTHLKMELRLYKNKKGESFKM